MSVSAVNVRYDQQSGICFSLSSHPRKFNADFKGYLWRIRIRIRTWYIVCNLRVTRSNSQLRSGGWHEYWIANNVVFDFWKFAQPNMYIRDMYLTEIERQNSQHKSAINWQKEGADLDNPSKSVTEIMFKGELRILHPFALLLPPPLSVLWNRNRNRNRRNRNFLTSGTGTVTGTVTC